ncbi:MAG: lasso peptide biosynthesis B2 protein, partial [Acidobacteriota bacterium]|nr:lasso peptide biosynthesis B2 protein [Acidobacteriota bacterium]
MLRLLNAARLGAGFALRRPGEALLVARMAACVASFSALARWLPLPRSVALLSPKVRRTEGGKASRVSDERVAELLDALLALDVLCFTPTCWKRAVVLHRQLALRGRATRVVFGVRRGTDDPLAGHAWLEAEGAPVFEPRAPEY